jgi:cytoskeletal protein CcmA (bactofilin family)
MSLAAPLRLDERRSTWIARSLVMRGHLTVSEDLVIDGTIEGTLDAGEHAVTIGPTAFVQADLAAATITIHGRVIGDVTARERLILGPTASLEGNVRASCLTMADGALLCGIVDTGRTPSRRQQP